MTTEPDPPGPERRQAELPLACGRGRVPRRTMSCLYCPSPATTADHVPPRVLLEQPFPANLRTAPACLSCNRGWSLDEEYLATVLALVGETPALQAKVAADGKVDRSLAGAPCFDDSLIEILSVDEQGRVRIEPNMARIGRVLEKVALGLHALRYGRGHGLGAFTCISVAGPEGELPGEVRQALWSWPGMKRKPWTDVQPGVFRFVFVTGQAPRGHFCVMALQETLVAAVRSPPPVARPSRLASAPW